MDAKILEYRKTHPKCKFCKYYKWYSIDMCHWTTCYGKCLLKEKIINYDNLLRLCKYYEVKESKNEI